MMIDFPLRVEFIILDPFQLQRVYAVLGDEAYTQKPVKAPEPTPVPTAAVKPEGHVNTDVEMDAEGTPFDPELHTGTKKKDGTWRLKRGAADKIEAAEAEEPDVDDEFAEFMEPQKVDDREYSDTDLSALCNKAAQKLGDPKPVKALINEYVPEGEVSHSRNIPAKFRSAFVAAVEAKAGIEFDG